MNKDIDIGRDINVISNKIRHIFDASFAGSGITGTQASILHFIYTNGKYHDVFPRDIEAEYYIRRSSVTSLLNGLERNGFIRRENVKEDARLKKLVLTNKAAEILEHVNEVISRIDSTMLRQINQQDIALLDALLIKIADNLP